MFKKCRGPNFSAGKGQCALHFQEMEFRVTRRITKKGKGGACGLLWAQSGKTEAENTAWVLYVTAGTAHNTEQGIPTQVTFGYI